MASPGSDVDLDPDLAPSRSGHICHHHSLVVFILSLLAAVNGNKDIYHTNDISTGFKHLRGIDKQTDSSMILNEDIKCRYGATCIIAWPVSKSVEKGDVGNYTISQPPVILISMGHGMKARTHTH